MYVYEFSLFNVRNIKRVWLNTGILEKFYVILNGLITCSIIDQLCVLCSEALTDGKQGQT